MPTIIYGREKGIFGMKDLAPISNLPADTIKVRIRMRPHSFAVAFVKQPNSITKWVLAEKSDGAPYLWMIQGSNLTP